MEIDAPEWEQILREGAGALGVELSDLQVSQFRLYGRLLVEANRNLNLTAITNAQDLALLHFVDCLAAVPLVADASGLLDLGTGAGFPGLVVKIALPGLAVTLVDSVRKKVSFLSHVIGTLGIRQVSAVHGRAQELARQKDFAHCFDVVTARAVTDLSGLWRLAWPFLSDHGALIAMKGREVEKEIHDLESLRPATGSQGFCVDVFPYTLPVIHAGRHMVRMRPSGPV